MAKLVALAAVMVALLAMSAATTAFRATITTVVDEQIPSRQRGGQQQQCGQQIEKQREDLRQCAMYLSQDQMSDHHSIPSIWGMPQQEKQYLSQCCDALENFDRQCRCEAVKATLRQVQQEQEQEQGQEQGRGQGQEQGRGQGQEQEQEQGQWQLPKQILQKAKYLPSFCNLEPEQCQIRTFYF